MLWIYWKRTDLRLGTGKLLPPEKSSPVGFDGTWCSRRNTFQWRVTQLAKALSQAVVEHVATVNKAKQFPGLDGRSAEERLKKYWRSPWWRQELNREKALRLGGLKRGLKGRTAEESCLTVLLAVADFKAFSVLSSARRIFFPSSSLSASSCSEYSSTVFQLHSDLSANKINFCLSVSSKVLSDIDSLAFSTVLFSRCAFAPFKKPWTSSLLNFFISLSCSSAN